MTLPNHQEMCRAFLDADSQFEGVFVAAVKTTGIFCRPTCPARRPKLENVEFYATVREAQLAGYRPCKRCRPTELSEYHPDWVRKLMGAVIEEPHRRWHDQDLRDYDIEPARARRWFQKHLGMTFHAYARAVRLGGALDSLERGASVTTVGLGHGYESQSGFNDAIKRVIGKPPGAATGVTLVHCRQIPTPLGPVLGAATREALVLLEFADLRSLERQCQSVCRRLNAVMVPGDNCILAQTDRELKGYFNGELSEFHVPVDIRGTAFQMAVWTELRTIATGETKTYSELARMVGRPKAVRAVGRANGDNRIAIIIPCHRVIGSNGSLTGYAGGLWRKQKLLELESRAVRV